MPPSARASASPTLAQVMPTAPAASCRAATCTHLWVLRVRPQLRRAAGGKGRHARHVALELVVVEQQRWRVDLAGPTPSGAR